VLAVSRLLNIFVAGTHAHTHTRVTVLCVFSRSLSRVNIGTILYYMSFVYNTCRMTCVNKFVTSSLPTDSDIVRIMADNNKMGSTKIKSTSDVK
jgi:hypothetical protein